MSLEGEERLTLPDVKWPVSVQSEQPENVTAEVLRSKLRESQLQDKETGPILRQLDAELHPAAYRKSATGKPKPKGPLRPPVADTMRVADDGVLEARILLHQGEA